MNFFSRSVPAGKGIESRSCRSRSGLLVSKVIIGILLFSAYPAYGQWITDGNICQNDPNDIHAPRPGGITTSITSVNSITQPTNPNRSYSGWAYSTTTPTSPTWLHIVSAFPDPNSGTPSGVPPTVDGGQKYMVYGWGATGEFCVYQFDLVTPNSATSTRINFSPVTSLPTPTPATSTATSIPVFSPFGLLAAILALFWVGFKSRDKKS